MIIVLPCQQLWGAFACCCYWCWVLVLVLVVGTNIRFAWTSGDHPRHRHLQMTLDTMYLALEHFLKNIVVISWWCPQS